MNSTNLRSSDESLLVRENEGILEVRLNRPSVRNAFSPDLIAKLTAAFNAASLRKDLRAVILTGAGKVFCAGADLAWMKESVHFDEERNKSDASHLHEMFCALADCPHPLIGVVQGAAYGGALGLIACCDWVLAEEKTQFCFSEVRLGIVPAVISEFVLRKATLGHVGPWMLSGRPFSTAQALQMGLVHEQADEEVFEEHVSEIIRDFGRVGPEAVRAAKSLLREMTDTVLCDTAELNRSSNRRKDKTVNLIARLRVSPEGQEGLKAFLEKRPPSWSRRSPP